MPRLAVEETDDIESLAGQRCPGLSARTVTYGTDGGEHLTGTRHEALRAMLQVADKSDTSLWLVAGHAYPQPRSTMRIRDRLWKGLARAGICFVEQGQACDEACSASSEGLRYFGYRRIGLVDVSPADEVLRRTQAFLVLGDEVQVSQIVNDGWDSVGLKIPSEALERCKRYRTGLAFVRGEFDDTVVEAILLGPKSVLPAMNW